MNSGLERWLILVKSLSSKTEDLGLVPNNQVKELSLAADA